MLKINTNVSALDLVQSENLPLPLVMVVDDRPDITDLLGLMVEVQGYRVIKYYDSPQALHDLEAKIVQPDLLLLDVIMPDLDGFEVTRRLRANSTLAYFPIVLLTAMQDEKSRALGLEVGADEFLSKPINRAELVARLRSLTRLKTTTEQLRRKTEENRRLNDELRMKNSQMAHELQMLVNKAHS